MNRIEKLKLKAIQEANIKLLGEQWEWLEDAGEYVADKVQYAGEYVTDEVNRIGRDLNDIWNDVKRAFREVPEIPQSFADLAKYISNPEQWKEVAKGAQIGADELGKVTQGVRNLDDNTKDKIKGFLLGVPPIEGWCKRIWGEQIFWPPCIILDVLDKENTKYSEQDEELNKL